jgi:MraZ protein
VLVGEYHHNLDSKGRFTLPARLRDAFADGLVLARGFEKSLFVFARTQWPKVEEAMRSNMLKGTARKLSRFFFSGVSEQEVDKQGRVMIPENLRKYAELDKEIVVVGVSDRLEIWSEENWQAYSIDAAENYEDLAESMADVIV